MEDRCLNPKCGRPRREFPMVFRAEDYCSDDCGKVIGQVK